MRRMKHLPVLALTLCLVACSTESLYLTAQQWQRQECLKLPDRDERARCEKSTARSFEDYKAEAAKKSKP
jgi:hypothetical protein